MRKKNNNSPISIEEGNSLDMYFDEISRQQPLTEDEEKDLAQRMKDGDGQAAERLITGNLRRVVAIAKQYQGQGVSLADLINEGNIGLIKAVGHYGEQPFASLASKYIRQSIVKAIAEQVPQTTPPLKKISVNAPLKSDNRLTMLDVMPNASAPSADADAEQSLLSGELEEKMSRLNERERTVIAAVYGIGQPHMTLAEVAEQMGIKRERARQIRDKALRAMRKK